MEEGIVNIDEGEVHGEQEAGGSDHHTDSGESSNVGAHSH